MKTLFIFLFLVVLLALPLGIWKYMSAQNTRDCSVTDDGVIEALNKERGRVGAKPLVFNKSLDQFAELRAVEMDGKLDNHAGFQPLINRTSRYGYVLLGEDQNVWEGCHSSYDRVQDFKLSNKHWKDLMDPIYDEAGVGFYKNVLNINLGDR